MNVSGSSNLPSLQFAIACMSFCNHSLWFSIEPDNFAPAGFANALALPPVGVELEY